MTTVPAPEWLPLVIHCPTPETMLAECKALSNDPIDAWVHAAAVLDYVVENAAEGKLASQQGTLTLPLVESPKHIMELKESAQAPSVLASNLNRVSNKPTSFTEPTLKFRKQA